LRYASGQTDRQTNKQTLIAILHTVMGRSSNTQNIFVSVSF